MIATDERIRLILTHPSVQPFVRDDFTDSIAPGFYLEPVEGVLVSFLPVLNTVWAAHIAALPESRGKGAEAVRLSVEWLRANTEVREVLAMFPEGNMPVLSLVRRTGFERMGELPSCFKRDGEWLSLHVYRLRVR